MKETHFGGLVLKMLNEAQIPGSALEQVMEFKRTAVQIASGEVSFVANATDDSAPFEADDTPECKDV